MKRKSYHCWKTLHEKKKKKILKENVRKDLRLLTSWLLIINIYKMFTRLLNNNFTNLICYFTKCYRIHKCLYESRKLYLFRNAIMSSLPILRNGET